MLAVSGSPAVSATVALALAASGRCAEAVEHERRLVAEARRKGDLAVAGFVESRLDHFAATGRCRDPWS